MNIDYPALEAAFQGSNYLDRSYWLNRETEEGKCSGGWHLTAPETEKE